MLRNVYFEGEMGAKFVPHMEIDCETTAEVFSCLNANFDNFMPYLTEKHNEDVGFHIEVAGSELEYVEECVMEIGAGDIIITPVPAGAGKGIGKILAAIAIVVVIAYTGGAFGAQGVGLMKGLGAAMAKGGLAGFFAKVGVGMALSLALTGLMEMMAPDPSVDGELEAQQSYLFNGNAQNIVNGDPVPVVYGRLRVPGQPIAFDMIGAASSNGADIFSATGGSIPQGYTTAFSSKDFDALRK